MAKVIKQYVDKYTHEMVTVGTELEDVSKERLKELIEAGVVEVAKESASKKKSNKA